MKQRVLSRDTLCGVWPALLTPWTEDDTLDEALLIEEIWHIADAGAHGTYTGGTAGEFYAQDDRLFEQLTALACRTAHDAGIPIQIGCSALSARIVLARIRFALEHGADAIQFTLPFWLALDDGEVLQFFAEVAEAAGTTPLIYYQTMRAKARIDPPLMSELYRRFPTFIGIKDTGCDFEILKKIVADAPNLAVFGTDADFLERMQLGARGSYSSVAGLGAKTVLAVYNHCAAGRYDLAEPHQDAIRRVMREVLIPIVKEAGLMDSAIDRVQRVVGGGHVGLKCQPPYRSASEEHVTRVLDWCRREASLLLQ